MLTRLAHRIAANPLVYEMIQRTAGVKRVHARLAAEVARLDRRGLMLDLGGGTGIGRFLWEGRGRYVCLDLDGQKLAGFRRKYRDEWAVLGDATRAGFAGGCADLVLCTFLTHHLS